MKLYIGFSKPRNHRFPIFSWAIRAFERTRYSHGYIRWYSKGANAEICYEASGNELKFVCKKVFDRRINPIHEYELEITKEQYRKLLNFCMTNAGVDYGVKQVFGILLVRLFGLKKNPFSDGRASWVCSEVAGTILQEIYGINLGLDLDVAGPKAIDKYLERCKYKKIKY